MAEVTRSAAPAVLGLDPGAIRERANADGAFRQSARCWNARVGFDLETDCFELRVRDGRVEAFARVPALEGAFDLRVSAPAQAWDKLLAPVPPPGFHDLVFGGGVAQGFSVRGDLVGGVAPYYAALQDFIAVVRGSLRAPPAARSFADVERAFDRAIGRYVYVRIDGVQYRVYFEEAGRGIPLLLQHTAGADGRQWRHVLEDSDYQREFRLIAYDLPFHGRSLPPTGVRWWEQEYRLSRDFLLKFVVALARALGLARPVYMGCSIGGHLAPDLALHHPREFRAVIGINAGLGTRATDPRTEQSFHHPRVASDWKAAAMLGCTSPTSPEALRRETAWVYGQGGPPVLTGDLHYYSHDHDLTAEQARAIDTSKLDVYLLTGEYDLLAGPGGTPALARSIPGARYRLIPGMGHFGPAENPADFKRALLPVLEEIATKARRADAGARSTAAPWTHGFADVGGLRMHFVEQGSGPAVLLLHGFPESWYSWRHQLPALAQAGFRALAPDQRGYGQTDAPEQIEAYSQLRLVGDAVGLLDALGIERAVVVGHDWGAPVAWNAALLRPDRFAAVVGVSVPWLGPLPGRAVERLAAQSPDLFNYVLYFQSVGPAEAELEADVRASLRRLFYALSGDLPTGRRPWGRLPRDSRLMDQMPEPPRPLAWLSEQDLDFFAGEFQRRGFGPGLNWYRNLDRSAEELHAFRGRSPEVPAAYLQGEFDFPGADAAALGRMAAKLSSWRGSEVIAGAGHWVQQERPAAFNAALLRFLAAFVAAGAYQRK